MNTSIWALVLGWVLPAPSPEESRESEGLPVWERPLADQRRARDEARAERWRLFPQGF